MQNIDYDLAFSVSSLGPKSFQKVLNVWGTSEKAWFATQEEYAQIDIRLKTYARFDAFRKNFNITEYKKLLQKNNVTFISSTSIKYPENFKKLENPPIGIFCIGNTKLLQNGKLTSIAIAVVGTRKITEYGERITDMLVTDLVKNNVYIVSGLALGVDAAAHRSAIKNNGTTIAVLACGVDCCLPSENYSLYSDIIKNQGLIISEYPLSQPPNKGTFLARNRLVAALSDGILITEAAEGSGSLVTAEWGKVLEKKVFAVPGQIGAQMSKGSMGLFRNGGILVQESQDILNEFSVSNFQLSNNIKMKNLKLSKEEEKIIKLLHSEFLTIDEISKKTKLNVLLIMQIVGGLEIRGIIENKSGIIYLKNIA